MPTQRNYIGSVTHDSSYKVPNSMLHIPINVCAGQHLREPWWHSISYLPTMMNGTLSNFSFVNGPSPLESLTKQRLCLWPSTIEQWATDYLALHITNYAILIFTFWSQRHRHSPVFVSLDTLCKLRIWISNIVWLPDLSTEAYSFEYISLQSVSSKEHSAAADNAVANLTCLPYIRIRMWFELFISLVYVHFLWTVIRILP